MTLSKRKDGRDWRVVANGKDTPICIIKGDPPRYREPQEWYVIHDTEEFLFTAKGLEHAMSRLAIIGQALTI